MSKSTSHNAPKFLVCVDKRTESQVALRLVSAKARQRHGKIGLIHVIPPSDFQTLPGIADRMKEEQRQEAEDLLQKSAEVVYNLSGTLPCILLKEGNIGDMIVSTAMEDYDTTVLVLGVSDNSSRGKLTSWLAGQLGSNLLIPVLLVPGNLTDEQLQALI